MPRCGGRVRWRGGVDVGEPGADAVLVTLQGVEVDGVGEVRGQELVALVLEPSAVLGQLGQFLGAGGEAFIERGPVPAEPIADDMQTALTERQTLIQTAARRLLHDAQEAGAAWVAWLGQPSSQLEARERWEAHAATVALYRYRYEITGTSPLGDAKTVLTSDQAAEYRAAQVALRGAQRANRDLGQMQDRVARRPDPLLRL